MGADVLRHFRGKALSDGRVAFYWEPSATLKALGMVGEALGYDRAKAEARAIVLNQQADEIRRDGRTPNLGFPAGSVGRLIGDYRASDEWAELKPRTRDSYDRWLDRLRDGFVVRDVEFGGVGRLPARAISSKVLKNWRKDIKAAAGAYEAYHAIGVMRALWAWAEEEEWIATSPARGVKNPRPPKRKHRWDLSQRAAFLQAAFDLAQYDFGVAMLVTDNIGQSPIDIWSLRVRDWADPVLRPGGRAKTGVGDDDGGFLLWDHVAGALRWLLSLRPALHPDALLFVNQITGTPWSESRRHMWFRRIRERAGLPKHLQWQDLRRTAATEAGEAGATAFEVQAQLRHTSTAEASTYVHTGASLFAKAAEKRMKRRGQTED